MDADGPICLSPECVTYDEFEVQVNELVKEIEAVKREAREKFQGRN